MRNRITFVAVVAFAWSLTFAGLAVTQAATPRLKVGHVGHDHHLPLYVAASLGEGMKSSSGGYWLKELKSQYAYALMQNNTEIAIITLDKVGGGAAMPAALAKEEIEVGFGGLAPTVAAIDQGARIKIVAPLNADGDMLLVQPDFPADNWQEFVAAAKESDKPIRIGYKAPTAVAYLIFIRALKEEGMTVGPVAVDENGETVSVVTINLQGATNMVPSMAKKIVDGIVMNQPIPAVVEDQGFGKVIADLRDLPPESKWHDHPCCCVAATESAIATKRQAVIGLLALVTAAGDRINESPEAMAALASEWTLKSESVEKHSIPTVKYIARPTPGWQQGTTTWLEMMDQLDWFKQRLDGVDNKRRMEIITDYSLLPETKH